MSISGEREVLKAAEESGEGVWEQEMKAPGRAKDLVYRLTVFRARVQLEPEDYDDDLRRRLREWEWRARGKRVILTRIQ